MKKISTLVLSFFFLLSVHAQIYDCTLSPSTGQPGSIVSVTFSLPSGSRPINPMSISSQVASDPAVQQLTTQGPAANTYSINFIVPAGLPVGTVILFSLNDDVTGTNHGVSNPFTVTGVILPVVYVSNSATFIEAQNKVLLSWNIASAGGVKEFNIMRSTDGINFTKIATVAANTYTGYVYSDILTNTTVNYYYKISGVTVDGVIKETGRMLIKKNNKTGTPVIFNNGNIKNELLVAGINLMEYKPGTIKVFDVAGRIYGVSVKSSNSIYLDNQSAGIYFLKIGDLTPVSFMKQ